MRGQKIIEPGQIVVIDDVNIRLGVKRFDTLFGRSQDRRHLEMREVSPLTHF